MYLKALKVSIQFHWLPQYLSTFYPKLHDRSEITKTVGDIVIEIGWEFNSRLSIDILPIINAQFAAPHFHCRFVSAYNADASKLRMLNQMLVSPTPTWRSYVPWISRVEICLLSPHCMIPYIHIWFKNSLLDCEGDLDGYYEFMEDGTTTGLGIRDCILFRVRGFIEAEDEKA